MKLFAVVENNLVIDGWIAESIEEATQDNPNMEIIEVTLNNGPWVIGKQIKK